MIDVRNAFEQEANALNQTSVYAHRIEWTPFARCVVGVEPFDYPHLVA